MITIAHATIEVTANSSHRSDMTSGGEVTDNRGDGATSEPAMGVTSRFGELDTALPCIYQIIDKRSNVVVEVLQ
jgi:hypothetical protein